MFRKIILGISLVLLISCAAFSQITWTEDSPVTTGSFNAIATADFNNDGLIDIAVAPAAGGITIYYRTTSGWSSPESMSTSAVFLSLAAGDIDFDGYNDIAGSGDGVVQAWLHKYNVQTDIFSWVSANTFSPAPSGTYDSITLVNVNKIEERYDCVTYTPSTCQTTTPHGLDIVLANGTQGLQIYTWAGMIATSMCTGSWAQESATGLPSSGTYSQVVGADLDGDQDFDLVASKTGGIDALFRNYTQSTSGCQMPDRNNNKYIPVWTIGNGQLPYSNLLPSTGDYRSVAVRDIDNDRYPDIIASGIPTENEVDSGIEVWYGKPASFEPGATSWLWTKELNVTNLYNYLRLSGQYNYIGFGQFSGDGIVDIAAVSASSPSSRVWRGYLFLEDTVSFRPEHFYWLTDSSPASSGSFPMLAVADFDQDGREDIAFPSNANGGVRVFKRTSADIIKPTQWYPTTIFSSTGSAGSSDVPLPAVRYSGSGYLPVSDTGNSGQPLLFSEPNPSAGVVALALDNSSTYYDILLFSTRGEGDWTAVTPPAVNGRFQDVQLGYINNDNYYDIAATKITASPATDGIQVWFGGTTGWTLRSTGLSGDAQYNDLSLADFNRDKFLDIAAAKTNNDGTTGCIEIWIGEPDVTNYWQWSLLACLQTANEAYISVVTGDFNNDGLTDVIGCSKAASLPARITAFYRTSTGGWQSEAVAGLSFNCWQMKAVDLNGDGWLDIAATLQGMSTAGGIILREHVPSGGSLVWQTVTSPDNTGSYSGIIATDLNADGCTDIAAYKDATPQALRTWFMYKVSGVCQVGTWVEQTQTDVGYSCSDLDVGELSLDHLPDLISTCDNSTGLHLLQANYNYQIPSGLTLSSPANGSTVTTRQPQLQLYSTSNYSDCLQYEIELDGTSPYDFSPPDETYPGFINPVGWNYLCNASTATAAYSLRPTDTYPGGLPNGLYYWRGRVYDGFTLSGAGSAWSFTVNPADTTPPVATNPMHLSKLTDGVQITWAKNTETDINRYRIFRSTAVNFTPLPSNMIAEYVCIGSCPATISYNDTLPVGLGQISCYKMKAVDTSYNQGP